MTLARRPDLAEAVYAIPYPPGSPAFMAGSLASLLVRGRRVARRWPHLVVALLDGERPIARGIMVPFRGRGSLPARGWDEVAVWAAEDALDDVVPDTACALEIAVHPDHQGRGHSGTVLAAMREAAAAAGLESLVIPVRPPDKAAVPSKPMREYAAETRADGLPADRWLRTHVRAGGRIEAIAPCSATVQAPLADWRRWTGLPFDRDGVVTVPGALAPVFVSAAGDFAVYVEPNVWVSHRPAARR
ncbi:GNAT family N-acetyltransferase [Amycolatopsis sp. NPDC049159]|uniref:GNAT family N-acetyltransferase n=1 Tax=Amycolatopsis sp. NPDC049159 TaxID=3157210 RepID=UPI0033E31087